MSVGNSTWMFRTNALLDPANLAQNFAFAINNGAVEDEVFLDELNVLAVALQENGYEDAEAIIEILNGGQSLYMLQPAIQVILHMIPPSVLRNAISTIANGSFAEGGRFNSVESASSYVSMHMNLGMQKKVTTVLKEIESVERTGVFLHETMMSISKAAKFSNVSGMLSSKTVIAQNKDYITDVDNLYRLFLIQHMLGESSEARKTWEKVSSLKGRNVDGLYATHDVLVVDYYSMLDLMDHMLLSLQAKNDNDAKDVLREEFPIALFTYMNMLRKRARDMQLGGPKRSLWFTAADGNRSGQNGENKVIPNFEMAFEHFVEMLTTAGRSYDVDYLKFFLGRTANPDVMISATYGLDATMTSKQRQDYNDRTLESNLDEKFFVAVSMLFESAKSLPFDQRQSALEKVREDVADAVGRIGSIVSNHLLIVISMLDPDPVGENFQISMRLNVLRNMGVADSHEVDWIHALMGYGYNVEAVNAALRLVVKSEASYEEYNDLLSLTINHHINEMREDFTKNAITGTPEELRELEEKGLWDLRRSLDEGDTVMAGRILEHAIFELRD